MGVKTRLLLFLAAIVALAAVSCCVTLWCIGLWHARHGGDDHLRIHAELGITAKQESRLHEIEDRYQEDRRRCSEKIGLANRELAAAIREDGQYSPRVGASVLRIQEAQTELKNIVLRHVFEMQEVLEAEQYRKLLELTAGALEERQKELPGH